ncbi:uncharacterized protein [Primulina huaijiensis]|uniref:uncharacterized protein n=1 Tax=Primulina huaijiensis TaxID=1492673 RepID=UPI003CC71E1F
MVAWWQELDQYHNDVWESQADFLRQKKREENDRIFMLLAEIHRNLDDVKGRILGRRLLPSIREVFSEVRLEESRRKIMNNNAPSAADPSSDMSALFIKRGEKGAESSGDKKKKPWCDFCKIFWHTRETCWKIHGKPPGGKSPRPERALQTMADPSQEHFINSGQSPFTKEQIEQLLNLLPSSQDKSSCTFVHNGSGLGNDDWQC